MAQMRHMHPLVETYLQDLKNDANGNASPVKDQYFLGRLDMSDGPEDVSFVGQPGFGHRMLSKLTGVYSLHYLPMGFAQMVYSIAISRSAITNSILFVVNFWEKCGAW